MVEKSAVPAGYWQVQAFYRRVVTTLGPTPFRICGKWPDRLKTVWKTAYATLRHCVGHPGNLDPGTKPLKHLPKGLRAVVKKFPGYGQPANSGQKSGSFFGGGHPARIAFSPDPVPGRCDNLVNAVAHRRWKYSSDSCQPTVSWEVVEDVKQSIAFLKQVFPFRAASKNENGIGIYRLRMISRDAQERLTLQRGKEECSFTIFPKDKVDRSIAQTANAIEENDIFFAH